MAEISIMKIRKIDNVVSVSLETRVEDLEKAVKALIIQNLHEQGLTRDEITTKLKLGKGNLEEGYGNPTTRKWFKVRQFLMNTFALKEVDDEE